MRYIYNALFFGVLMMSGGVSDEVLAESSKKPDNSEFNKLDYNQNLTAEEQSNVKEHVELTKKIRAAITSNDALSTYAHNVKIITDKNGDVTLKGPVRSAQERKEIVNIARQFAGSHRVNDELDITAG